MKVDHEDELQQATVYLHLPWRWSIASVPVLSLGWGLIPAGLYGMLLLLNAYATADGPRTVMCFVACVLAVAWQTPELLMDSRSRRVRKSAWGIILALALPVLLSFLTSRTLPLWPLLPIAAAGLSGIAVLEFDGSTLTLRRLWLYRAGPAILAPTMREAGNREKH